MPAKQAPARTQMGNLQTQLQILNALLAHTCGESFETFNGLNENEKQWYLLHASHLAMQCTEDAERITELPIETGQAAIAKGKE